MYRRTHKTVNNRKTPRQTNSKSLGTVFWRGAYIERTPAHKVHKFFAHLIAICFETNSSPAAAAAAAGECHHHHPIYGGRTAHAEHHRWMRFMHVLMRSDLLNRRFNRATPAPARTPTTITEMHMNKTHELPGYRVAVPWCILFCPCVCVIYVLMNGVAKAIITPRTMAPAQRGGVRIYYICGQWHSQNKWKK